MTDQTTLYALRIDDTLEHEQFNQLLADFRSDIRDKILAYRFPQDRLRSLSSHLLVREVFTHRFKFEWNGPFGYMYGQNGKPFIENGSNLKFNVSHSADWIVCAISTDEVGMDIEFRKNIDLAEVDHVLSAKEKEVLEATPSDLRTSLFYDIWTLKESYLKALGGGLNGDIALHNLSVDYSGSRPCLTLGGEPIKEWFFDTFSIDSSYSSAVCYRSKNLSKVVTILKIEDIIGNTLSS